MSTSFWQNEPKLAKSKQYLSFRAPLDLGNDPRGAKFVETRTVALEAPLAAFELARHARQRVLHQPDIAAGRSAHRRRPSDIPMPQQDA
jgi:hypothetical protein